MSSVSPGLSGGGGGGGGLNYSRVSYRVRSALGISPPEGSYSTCDQLISVKYTSDVLEHKWRASLKTMLFLYE